MSDDKESHLTQSFLGLSDEAFRAVPNLEKALIETLNTYKDVHGATMGTVVTALAFVIGEYILMAGDESGQLRAWFLKIMDAYISTGIDGARTGPDTERSLVRSLRPWRPRQP